MAVSHIVAVVDESPNGVVVVAGAPAERGDVPDHDAVDVPAEVRGGRTLESRMEAIVAFAQGVGNHADRMVVRIGVDAFQSRGVDGAVRSSENCCVAQVGMAKDGATVVDTVEAVVAFAEDAQRRVDAVNEMELCVVNASDHGIGCEAAEARNAENGCTAEVRTAEVRTADKNRHVEAISVMEFCVGNAADRGFGCEKKAARNA